MVGVGTPPPSTAPSEGDVPMETSSEGGASAATPAPTSPKEKKYYIDTTFITPAREGVEIMSPLKDGLSKLSQQILWEHLRDYFHACIL